MTRGFRRLLAALLALILLLLGLLLTLTQWLPRLAGIWLPDATRIELSGGLGWQQGAVTFPRIRYLTGECMLAEVNQVGLKWQSRWQLSADRVTLNSACLQALPQSERASAAPRSLAAWQQLLPGADITFGEFSILPWQQYAGQLTLNLDKRQQRVQYRGDNLSVSARLQGRTLTLASLQLQHPLLPQPVTLHGEVTLPEFADGLPVTGALESELQIAQWPQPLRLDLQWQQQQGTLRLREQRNSEPLLVLPWQAVHATFRISEGRWRWPLAKQTLQGGVSLSLDNWQQGIAGMRVAGRLNLLTQGQGGKGNVVLSVGPGALSLTDNALPLRITGESKFASLQLYGSIPGELRGDLTSPRLSLQPGALLRLRGQLLDILDVDEARWPLAGVSLSAQGIDGRLQAILTAHNRDYGRFTLHLDGGAKAFWPDSGEWRWRYWGGGELQPLHADWKMQGTGSWQNSAITLDKLVLKADQLMWGAVQVSEPRLQLTEPLRWQRSAAEPVLSGRFRLNTGQTTFSYGGWLPPTALTFDVQGSDPQQFLWRGELSAEDIGPLRVHGRWDGARLRGEAWWPSQSLQVFQPLVNTDLNMRIQSGELRAQMAFSAAAGQGFAAGGFFAVQQGNLHLPDSSVSGVDFALPFRYKAQQWQLGRRGPVSLRIREITNQFALQNISADLQGYYPWQQDRPLTLSNVNIDLLGGQVTLPQLRLPQQQAAHITLRQIDLSRLVTALKPKQFAMSGKVNGELPLWVNNPHWLIEKGWIANSGPLTFRLDKDMADTIAKNNIAAGVALDWLRYLEISRSWATLDLDNIGNLTMQSQVTGLSRFSNQHQIINLNYRHQENLFQLWRSLRFGDNLQSWVEDNATLPAKRENR